MSSTVLVSLVMYLFVTSITPGPNNMLLASSGLTYGLRRTVPQILGVGAGFVLLLVVVAFGLGIVFAQDPRIMTGLKVVGVGYFIYLAWKLWHSAPSASDPAGSPIGFWQAVMFQFINPKGLLMAITVVAVFTIPGPNYIWSVVAIVIADILVGFPCSIAWAAFGATIRARFSNTDAFVRFNKAMAILTALTAILIVTE